MVTLTFAYIPGGGLPLLKYHYLGTIVITVYESFIPGTKVKRTSVVRQREVRA